MNAPSDLAQPLVYAHGCAWVSIATSGTYGPAFPPIARDEDGRADVADLRKQSLVQA